MKRIVFPFLSMLMLVFSGCMKPGNNIQCYQDVPIPAIVDIDFSTFQPLLITPIETFIAPGLKDKLYTEIYEGDALITFFCIDYDQQPYANNYMVSDLQYVLLEKTLPQATTGGESSMAGDFIFPVEGMEIAGLLENVMFIYFFHKAASNQKFAYEMTYDRDNTADIPILYIRAKKSGENLSGDSNVGYPYAFNMHLFFSQYKDSNNKVRFEIHYKTGVDDEGKDKYDKYNHPNMGTTIEIPVE